MIPTAGVSRYIPWIAKRHIRSGKMSGIGIKAATVLMLSVVTLAGCTNSKLIISPLYNRLDNQIRSEFNKLADFNDEQNAAFEAAVGTFHVWHRQSEMPQYAALLQEISESIAEPDKTQPQDVKRWAATIETFSRSLRECHPVNYLSDITKSLTDEQISFIERRFKNERRMNRERYESRTLIERQDFRFKKWEKWAGRIGLEFTDSQREALRTSLSQQISLRRHYYRLSDQWNRELFILVRDQDAENYAVTMRAHFGKLWSMLESEYPKLWRQNRQLWQDTSYRLIHSMTSTQRKSTSQWLSKMSKTVQAISKIEPSFSIGSDPAIGCLPNKTS